MCNNNTTHMTTSQRKEVHEARTKSLVNALIIVKVITPHQRQNRPEESWSKTLRE